MRTIRSPYCWAALGLLLLPFSLAAQCPASERSGVHVVQKGENLYRIALKYKVKVEDLCEWNNMKVNDPIESCSELLLQEPTPARAQLAPKGVAFQVAVAPQLPPIDTNPVLLAKLQNGGLHRVQDGETAESIADTYGYTARHFRMFNGLKPNETLKPGMLVRISDCMCSGHPSEDRLIAPLQDMRMTPPSLVSTAPPGKSDVDQLLQQPEPYKSGDHFEEPEKRLTAKEAPKVTPEKAQAPSLTGKKTESATAKSAPNAKEAAPAGAKSAEAEKSAAAKTTPAEAAAPEKDAAPAKVEPAAYMNKEELAMLNEINLLRSNPAAYIRFVDEYVAEMKKNGEPAASIAVAKELTDELRKTPRLSKLEATECIYRSAKKHGEDQRPTGDVNHKGSDGSWPWDRVKRECPEMKDGGENIVAGPASIRRAIILLLVDDGVDNRGHRKMLLNPEWKYAACYKIGQVGPMPNYWVQKFGL